MNFWKAICETIVLCRHVRRFSALGETSLCLETVSFFAHKLDPSQAFLKRACEASERPLYLLPTAFAWSRHAARALLLKFCLMALKKSLSREPNLFMAAIVLASRFSFLVRSTI